MLRERAEIQCLACGRELGQIEKTDGRVRLIAAVATANTARVLHRRGLGLICGRCGGRALVGPMERVASYAA